ncbi:MAG TPA: hypothetical protein VMW35_20465 [Myxococcota bacterium]|jgi:hypothetical protein|nr:hypothetical protein [Myxococcota bacterium]
MAGDSPRSFFATLPGILTGLAAVLSASVTAYGVYRSEREPHDERPASVAFRSFEASPLEVEPGGAVVLHWRAENADECSLEPGVGRVGAAGSRSVKPTEDTTYTIVCRGSSGESERSVSVSVLSSEPEAPVAHARQAAAAPPQESRQVETERARRETLDRLARLADKLDAEDEDGGASSGFDVAAPPPAQSAPLAYHCCDLSGMPRCPLVSPVMLGSGCFCPFQGTGIACP